MEKNRLFLILIISLTFSACKISEKPSENKNSSENQTCMEFQGKWQYITTFTDLDYSLELKVEGLNIEGYHCFIKGELGEQMDCPDGNSFKGKCNQNQLSGTFQSDWSNSKIKAIGTLKGDTLIVINTPTGSDLGFFYGEMRFLRK